MTQPTTRATLKDYAKRQLGHPVVELNIDDDQMEDRIDDALEFFQEYHFDGTYPTFLKHLITSSTLKIQSDTTFTAGEEITGGTFTISNGGVFGSLLSTPILNPPQTAILGMHKIQDRPMSVDGEIKILPMMYLALSYDHRMIDGKEAVQFLDTIKELIEDPTRLLLEI